MVNQTKVETKQVSSLGKRTLLVFACAISALGVACTRGANKDTTTQPTTGSASAPADTTTTTGTGTATGSGTATGDAATGNAATTSATPTSP